MWAAIRLIRLFIKSLSRIADSLDAIRVLYELDLEARGIRRITAAGSAPRDRVEVMYGSIAENAED